MLPTSLNIINARPDRTRYRSLTDTQLQIVRTLIRPSAVENPFPERLQLRNWLMIELLLETGIRRGELLKLYSTDINKGSQHAYVSINDREHDPRDPRVEEPALKTHGRTVGISAQLYEVYERYIQSDRRPLRDGKPMKLLYRYLFISDRGRPLSIRALSNVLDRLFLTIVCGWSETSTMPRRYAGRYLAESANLHNAQRTSAAWSRLDS